MTINLKGQLIGFEKPLVMGILNITPDSFYKDSRLSDSENIKDRITKMFKDGADIIDIGAMSSRPGAGIINEKEEWSRLEPVLSAISKDFADKYFSVDTLRASIAERSVAEYGISIINDISGGEFDKDMFETVAKYNVPYIIMHMVGTPENMQQNVNYDSIIDDIILYFSNKTQSLKSLGVNDVIIDPGFGFSKTVDQNYFLLNKLDKFKIFELPILAGLSRKSMIWKQLNLKPETALNGTSVLNTIALNNGANILRVHDVVEAKQCVELFHKTQFSI